MVMLIDGPLSIGNSTLAEALMERLDNCVMLDDAPIVVINPPAPDGPWKSFTYLCLVPTLCALANGQAADQLIKLNPRTFRAVFIH